MPLFQKSLLSKYLKAQNKERLISKWKVMGYELYGLTPEEIEIVEKS
jgi:hypothetical protein